MSAALAAAPAAAPIGCPAEAGDARSNGHDILIAWDGSASTIAALQTVARSSTAGRFILLEVARARPSAHDAAAWLNSHGASARVQPLSRREMPLAALRRICGEARPLHCLAGALCRRDAAMRS